jgi:hypothetical protein
MDMKLYAERCKNINNMYVNDTVNGTETLLLFPAHHRTAFCLKQ